LPASFDTGFILAVGDVFANPSNSNSALYNFANGTPGKSFEDDISYTSDAGEEITCFRLREGIERFFITDINNPAGSAQAQSELPVIWDTVWTGAISGESYFNHIPGGGNVLYMDGHVVFVRYPGEWPICRAFPQMMDTMKATLNP
jgi:prepilin-type processing-associated H-X9-DG protein